MKNILIVTCLLLNIAEADFKRDNTLEVIKDPKNYLMWQDDDASTAVVKTWEQAVVHCEDMVLAGYKDWRLPDLNELQSVGDSSKYNPSIKDAFENASSTFYWSSTVAANNSSKAWFVYFYHGGIDNDSKRDNNYVRCVRDG